MSARAGWVAHVVQAVEEADQVIAAVERRRRGDVEADPVSKTGVGGSFASGVYRPVVRVEADDCRGWVCLGEQKCGRPMTATDVRDARAGVEFASTPSRAGIQSLARLLR